MLSINKLYTIDDHEDFKLRHDWNSLLSDGTDNKLFKDFTEDYYPSKESMVEYIGDYCTSNNLNIKYNTDIINIKKKDNYFIINDNNNNTFQCEVLIVATGLFKPYAPKIEGIEHCIGYHELSSDSKSMEQFKNKKVLIIGNGNSAFEVANSLTNLTQQIRLLSRSPIKLAWQTHYVGDLRAVNNDFIDTYQLKSLNIIDNDFESENTVIIKKDDKLIIKNDNDHGEYDFIIHCTGWSFDDSIFDTNCKPVKKWEDKLPHLKSNYESINVDNLYFAGTLMQSCSYNKSTLAFIHGFRYAIRFLYRELNNVYSNKNFHFVKINNNVNYLADFIIERLSTTSGLFQLFSYYCDVIILNEDSYDYYMELPIDYVLESNIFDNKNIIVISFEYGFDPDDDVLSSERINRDMFYGYKSKFLHPKLQYYPNNKNKNDNSREILYLCLCGRWEKLAYLTNNYICSNCSINRKRTNNIDNNDEYDKYDINNYIFEHHITEDLNGIFKDLYYSVPLVRYLSTIVNNRTYYVDNIVTRTIFENSNNNDDTTDIQKLLLEYNNKNINNRIMLTKEDPLKI